MQTSFFSEYILPLLMVAASLFIFVIGAGLLFVLVIYVIDVNQTKHAIRRNFPVIGRLRYIFEDLGVFFRQYFYSMDREEMPFNREQRAWVYRAAKDIDNTVPFGSTRMLSSPGTAIFANAAFPLLEDQCISSPPMVIGAGCPKPFEARSFFNISAMSYGAISQPAITALGEGARLGGCWLNTGEGGLSPWHLASGADLIFQIGTAKYGVGDGKGGLDDGKLGEIAAHPTIRMFEIKLSQGAKPGKGGILPGAKVTSEIATTRSIPVGEDSISPNRHLEIDDLDSLLDFIDHVRTVTGKPTGIKFVVGDPAWLDDLLAAIASRNIAPDFITLDSADGGTGAAPEPLIDYVGLPVRESLPLLIDKLAVCGLRDRIRVIASGKMINPGDVAWALCAGADFINTARGFMFSLGCIQALQCNKNTCPTGITTHQKSLQRGLDPTDKSQRVRHYIENMVHEVGLIAHSCGVAEPRLLQRHHCRIIQPDSSSQEMRAIP